jgi:NhaP-type Na+/H+ or K+/H+ antiporter
MGPVLSEAGLTTNQILTGVGLILALAVGSQVLASRLRIPAIIVLLPAGFVAGAQTTDVDPQRLLGPVIGTALLWLLLRKQARPIVAFASTLRTDLTKGERAFTGWMAPRGIVAAATASTFAAGLVAKGIGGAGKILPATFVVLAAQPADPGHSDMPAVERR